MSYNVEKYRTRYARCKESGICVACGQNPARPGKVKCTACAEKIKRYNAETYAWYRVHGYCVECHHAKTEKGHSLCKRCKEKQKKAFQKYLKKKRGETKQ